MIVRTPPAKRGRGGDDAANPAAGSGRPPSMMETSGLVIYEDPTSPSPSPTLPPPHSDTYLCTYQCRQMVKSDFMEALSSAEKRVKDYEAEVEALNKQARKAEEESSKYRDALMKVEQELAASKGREQSLHQHLLKEINDSQQRLKQHLDSHSQLEVKLENEKKLRSKAESAAASAQDKASLLEAKFQNVSETIDREKRRLNYDLEHLKRESKLSVSRIAADLEKMECRAKHAEKESQILKEQLENLSSQLNQSLHQRSELERKLSSSAFQEGSSTDNSVLVKHLQEELRNYESEVREARKFRSSYESIELLKEKLLEEKGRRERAESELYKMQEFELNMKKLEDELSSLKSIIKDIPGVSSYEDLPLKFSALQKEVIDSMMKVGEANAALKQLEVALDTAQLNRQNAETEAALVKEKVEALKLEVKQAELLLSTVSEERDRLKSVVDELKRSKNDQAGDGAASGTLLQELESSLAKKEFCIKELESNLREQKEINNRQLDEIKMLNDKLNNEARRIKSLEREGDRLRSEISLLESKLGHGDFSASNTKVLRMVNTLAVDNEAKQTIEALQSELQRTKEKLQAVEEFKGHTGDADKLVDISGKITQLKEQIATLEKREERYKTVFADRISVFRRACCELFGYKIVMDEQHRPNGIPITRFMLQSIYAQSDDEKLEFEYESGNTNILANDYTSQSDVSRQVDIFIRKMNSIPAFTANLTVETFNRRTLS
ncbi:hypothetical protein Tsubulata_010318 [Turnera subulata]|uniref:Mitotic spindle checkpoint protein MAD1 n=1 Tax=Turnera subulata TaxID=218843 RepID=A0A9Q0GDA4_9ROSI|nr:hypothetical protein Tsubulata_010318 [Turnera subulata]